MNYLDIIAIILVLCAGISLYCFVLRKRPHEPTVKGFLAFVKNQNPKRKINQEYYTQCALGLYLRTCGVSEECHFTFREIFKNFAEQLPSPVNERIQYGHKHSRSYKTYGELLTDLQSDK